MGRLRAFGEFTYDLQVVRHQKIENGKWSQKRDERYEEVGSLRFAGAQMSLG